jgi:hypothetical protein
MKQKRKAMNDDLIPYKISSDLFVIVVKTTRAFREVFAQTIALDGHAAQFNEHYPELAKDGLPPDKMGIFIVGQRGETVNPNKLSYAPDTGTLSFEKMQMEELSIHAAMFIPAPKTDKFQIEVLGHIGVLAEETIFSEKSGTHTGEITAEIRDDAIFKKTPPLKKEM